MSDSRCTAYDQLAAVQDWDEFANRVETQRRIEIVFNRLLCDRISNGTTVLDAGSGGGHFSAEAERRGATVTSLDVGFHLLDQVKQRCGSTRLQGSLLDLPFPDGTFDIVLSTEVIEHTTDPERALRELARVIQPGGTLAVTTPGRLWQPVVRLATSLGLRPYEGYENFFWPAQTCRIIESSGVDVKELFGFNLLPLFSERWQGFHNVADRLGPTFPGLFVNYALRGVKNPAP